MGDWFDELVALAPPSGVFCAPPSLRVWVIVDERSDLRIINTPLFFARGEAEAYVKTRFQRSADSRLLVTQVRFLEADRLF